MRRCLVVGGSGDIGRAICDQLLQDGWEIGVHYNSNRPDFHPSSSCTYIQGDLSSPDGIDAFLGNLTTTWDAVIFAAGTSLYGLFQEATDQQMDELYHIHVKSIWKITRHVLPGMISEKHGNLVVVTSVWGEGGASMEVLYSSVKGAQRAFVHALSKEVGRSGIRVNGIAPGMIDTKMNGIFEKEDIEAIEEEIPLHRQGQTREVADVARFLLGKRASYVTGEIINVSGGWK
ncbi:elongation factor P 5-aminopentanone reductase [Salimicrobium halophilum]|uniref:3-oxoacyl-[acyl-carrier protein] reductase n=1 Tax=Salimicrobium halophilum TaxID=86666 RepID=A0A1G8Q7U9_9BACI|nr:SDR family oxidoreductase [Salimicrobium halophilum]SDJ00678.1 3-oxoacyl-[acyl-carrier protein] reductase [Salimicrobium halophilum]